MDHRVDARGLACPEPVIQTKKTLEKHGRAITIVDNSTAVENIRRMATGLGFTVSEQSRDDGMYLTIEKGESPSPHAIPDRQNISTTSGGPLIIIFSRPFMGEGDDELGAILVKSFFHTIVETGPAPGALLLYNSGVLLAVEGSGVVDDIQSLESMGTKILVCGTCLDYYNLKDKLIAGSVSNMYDIKESMYSASLIIRP